MRVKLITNSGSVPSLSAEIGVAHVASNNSEETHMTQKTALLSRIITQKTCHRQDNVSTIPCQLGVWPQPTVKQRRFPARNRTTHQFWVRMGK